MNNDAAKLLVEKTEAALNPVVRLEGERAYLLREPDGFRRVEVPLNPQNLYVYTVDDLLATVRGAFNGSSDGVTRKILVSAGMVTGMAETELHRQTFVLALPVHPAFAQVKNHLEPRKYSREKLVHFLRTRLNGFVSNDLISALQVLKFSSAAAGEIASGNGANSLKSAVIKEVQLKDGSKPPEVIQYNGPVYDVPYFRDLTYTVDMISECEANETETSFEIAAVHNQVADAQHQALERVREEIEKQISDETEVLPVYLAQVG